MNTTTENGIRCAAKDWLKEITTLTKGKPVSQYLYLPKGKKNYE